MSTYLSAFFSLPVKWSSGETLSHEEVVNKLDDETVSYEVGFGISNICTETLRVSLKVETARYEQAVAWLRDLLYGSQFTKERLAVAIAKIQQSLPELKRDGNTVLGSVWSDLLFSEKSTSRLSGVLPQMEFIPKLAEQLRSSPDAVISDFEIIRESCQYLTVVILRCSFDEPLCLSAEADRSTVRCYRECARHPTTSKRVLEILRRRHWSTIVA